MKGTVDVTAGEGDARSTRRVQSVDHAVDLLEAIAAGPADGLGVSELARQTGLSKATTHHLLITLESRRLVLRDAHSATYRLGWALHELGTLVSQSVDVARAARPFLDELALETGESILLGVRVDRTVQYVDRGDARSGFTMQATTGMRSLLHTNASGKLLLAHADDEFIKGYLADPLESFTPQTITEPQRIADQLAEIRDTGFATCWQERERGLCSIAVGVRDFTGGTVAALTVAGPAGRVTPDDMDRYLVPLRAAARQIENRLGAPAAG
ncbi:IclR family transcriptional regulator [Pseudonocardia hierapolitana]|uniref:Glycerol operon regulatory protein n=1 Tax=Pseudonocardia hierapolitana TaxID=1128676 RepID=A0A561SJF9_9PSEU|nr:IclR family transcriptional regulator [Pseudonocardia hierapolitana]TWF75017.1 IclR family transcriptional regulator [Pseudonocardia hierapolitana]